MKNFYILVSINEPENAERIGHTTGSIKKALERQEGVSCTIHEGLLDRESHIPGCTDCVITVGGDGTMLRAARAGSGSECLFIGINRGHVGYLTELSEINDYDEFARRLVHNEFTIEERMMLSAGAELTDGSRYSDTALNDVLLCQSNSVRMMDYEVYVNGTLLNSYKADGMLVASPTGSTGYSMSAGGPIAEPSARLLILTPVCPHSLNQRSVVLSADDIVDLVPKSGTPLVSCDGARAKAVPLGKKLTVTAAGYSMKFIKLKETSFLDTLRDRMRKV